MMTILGIVVGVLIYAAAMLYVQAYNKAGRLVSWGEYVAFVNGLPPAQQEVEDAVISPTFSMIDQDRLTPWDEED